MRFKQVWPTTKQVFFGGVCVLLIFSVFSCSKEEPKPEPKTALSTPTPTPDQMMAKASRRDENGWIYVHLEGPPDVVGYQHGYLLANEILDLRGALSMLLEHDTKRNWDFYRT